MNFPIIKIDIEGMRYQVVHALEKHEEKETQVQTIEEILGGVLRERTRNFDKLYYECFRNKQ